jgi:hypothetical protein
MHLFVSSVVIIDEGNELHRSFVALSICHKLENPCTYNWEYTAKAIRYSEKIKIIWWHWGNTASVNG